MKAVNVVYDLITYKILRIEVDCKSTLARNERVKTLPQAVYKQLASHNEVAKALGLQ